MSLFRALLLLPCLVAGLPQAAAAPQSAHAPTPATAVVPETKTIDLNGKHYTRRETEFDPKTGVTTVYFDVEGVPSGTDAEGVILNFYGWNPVTTPAAVAETLRARQDGTQILFAFQAPDPATKEPAFFLVSETRHTDRGYGYANITKVAAIDGSAYAVTYGRRIPGGSADVIDANIKAWLASGYAKKVQDAVGNVNITGDWRGFLGKRH